MSIKIGPARVADSAGTHEPGSVVDRPTPELLALAEAKTKDPETGEFLCEILGAAVAREVPKAPPPPAPEKT